MTNKKENTALQKEQSQFERHRITADQMPKVKEPVVLIVCILVSILGCIVGLQVQVHTGTTPVHLSLALFLLY